MLLHTHLVEVIQNIFHSLVPGVHVFSEVPHVQQLWEMPLWEPAHGLTPPTKPHTQTMESVVDLSRSRCMQRVEQVGENQTYLHTLNGELLMNETILSNSKTYIKKFTNIKEYH